MIVQLPVGNKTVPTGLAGAIAGFIRDKKEVELIAIGAGAVHKMGLAIAVARIYLEGDKLDIFERPRFESTKVVTSGAARTAIVTKLEPEAIK